MSDEVAAAKAAVAQYKSSDADGELSMCVHMMCLYLLSVREWRGMLSSLFIISNMSSHHNIQTLLIVWAGAGPETAFDNILSGKWPSNKVYEDDTVLAFRDINPQAPVHIIVIPKHRDGLTKLSNARDDQEGILGHLMFVAQSVGKKECPEGFRVVINDGEHGAQSVYHLHLHVVGGRQMGWPPG